MLTNESHEAIQKQCLEEDERDEYRLYSNIEIVVGRSVTYSGSLRKKSTVRLSSPTRQVPVAEATPFMTATTTIKATTARRNSMLS
jgi:uncharacterized protein YcfJ